MDARRVEEGAHKLGTASPGRHLRRSGATSRAGRDRARSSVVLCTYNGRRYLPEQLASLTHQTLLPDEIVVCDDASTDGTWELLETFATSSPCRVRLYRNARNCGLLANFENALSIAAGDLVFLCDQDDVWHPDKVAAFHSMFLEDPEVGLIFSDAEMIDGTGRLLGARAWNSPQVGFSVEAQDRWRHGNAFEQELQRNVVTGATMGFRATYLPLILPFPPALGPWYMHDRWIALLLTAVTRSLALGNPYTSYRIHGGQQLGLPVEKETWISSHSRPVDTGRRVRAASEAAMSALLDRLDGHTGTFRPHPQDLESLRRRVQHLRTRSSLPRSPVKRAKVVYGELRSGRYSQFSSGHMSALVDLVVAS